MESQSARERKGRWVNILLTGVLLLGTAEGARGLADEGDGKNRFGPAFLGRFGHDFAEVLTAPGHWDRGDFLKLAAISGGGFLLMAFDTEIQDWMQPRRTSFSDKASSTITLLGNGVALLGLSAAIYAAGEFANDDGLRKTALLSLESLTTASFLIWMAKWMAGRARPYTGESSASFHPFALKSKYWSFPSGHAAAAFAVATTIALQSKSVFVDITAYTMACLVGIARVHDNEHWASDVFIGSVLGYLVARKITELNGTGGKRTLSLGVRCSGERKSLTLSIAF